MQEDIIKMLWFFLYTRMTKCIARPANSSFLFVNVVLNFKTRGTYSDYIIYPRQPGL